MIELAPTVTYQLLLVVQALHLFHHRFARRHISYAEGTSAADLCIPPSAGLPIPGLAFVVAHSALIALHVVGSIWIKRLAPS